MANLREIWKDIPGYEGRYLVSNMGRVKSIVRKKHVILKSHIMNAGYLTISLIKNKKHTHHLVHRLVLTAFVGESTLVCDHLNTVPTDNRLENLEWVTTKENVVRSRHPKKLGPKAHKDTPELEKQKNRQKRFSRAKMLEYYYIR